MTDSLPPVDVASARPAKVIMTSPDGTKKVVTRVPLREIFEIFPGDPEWPKDEA